MYVTKTLFILFYFILGEEGAESIESVSEAPSVS